MEVVDQFNFVIDEFINKMIVTFPDENKLKTFYAIFKSSKMFQKDIPLQMFMGGSIPFKDQIKNRNAEFFLSRPTFIESCVKVSSFSNDIGLVDQWVKSNEATKTAIWDYFQTLYVLGEMYMSKDSDAINKINLSYNNFSSDEYEMNYGEKLSK